LDYTKARYTQTQEVTDYISKLNNYNNVIMCGDFNSEINSDIMEKFLKLFKVPDKKNTYSYKNPKTKIDYILISKNVSNYSEYNIIDKGYSDHYPLMCKIYVY